MSETTPKYRHGPLSPEQRVYWADYVAMVRKYHPNLNETDKDRLHFGAIVDTWEHLEACEALLREIGIDLTNLEYRANKNVAETIRLDRPIASAWKARIAALLGPG